MRAQGVHIATIGQYLRPSLKHWPVDRYVDEGSYAAYTRHGDSLGFTHTFAGAFVRSSYHAKEAHQHHTRTTIDAPSTSKPSLLRVLP
jgi:lipoic acid synthetase